MQTKRTKKSLKVIRRKLRNNNTPAEYTLWKFIRNSQLGGRKFTRQYSIGNYIYDFYCSSEKLIIELDGEYIHSQEAVNFNDIDKQEFAESLGIKLIRFKNNEIFHNLNDVLECIQSNFR